MNIRTEVCKSVAKLMNEVAKIPEDFEVDDIEDQTLKDMSIGLLYVTDANLSKTTSYISSFVKYIQLENDEIQNKRTHEYDTDINKDLGILGSI